MKILICTGIYPPDSGGPATYSKLIQDELTKRGHSVSILSYGYTGIRNQESGIKFISREDVTSTPPLSSRASEASRGISYVSRKDSTSIRYIKYFLKVLKLGKNVDLIYIMDPVSVGFPSTLANIFLNKKLVLKVVGDYAWEQAMQIKDYKLVTSKLDDFYPFANNHSFKIKVFKIIQIWVATFADKIITPSFYLKDILSKGWGIDDKKIEVIYNSYVIQDTSNKKQEINKSQISNPKFKILSVARLVPWKGLDTLIDIVGDMENVELEIVGDGPEYENYESRIKNKDINNVRLLGRLSQSEVVQKMCSSDLFILNSAYEGLSHVLLEAMASGLPVATSREGGNTELIGENEERGFLFPYNNKEKINYVINYVIDSVADAKEKAKKARNFVYGFGEGRMIDKLENLLKSLDGSSDASKN